ncbi:MAG TPA: hypothetical protein VG275_00360 [Solirubrobacteraceae bacterium]|jgi:hypothetical protein|nr:hypothetical protein [Solirubrobacteraceae bacterium]
MTPLSDQSDSLATEELRVAVAPRLHLVLGDVSLCGDQVDPMDIHEFGRGWDCWSSWTETRCEACDRILADRLARDRAAELVG